MPDDTLSSLELNSDLRRQLVAEAEAEDRTVSDFLRTLLHDHLARKQESQGYDAWFDAEIEQALKEADDPLVIKIPAEVVQADLEREIALLRERI